MSIVDSRECAALAIKRMGIAQGEIAWALSRIPDETSLLSYRARIDDARRQLETAVNDLVRAQAHAPLPDDPS